MKIKLICKTLVTGIVVLFVGAVVVPSISSVNNYYKIQDSPIEPLSFDPYSEGWEYRKTIIIDHDMVTGNLNYFPVLISTTDDDLKVKAQNDGDDILFMDDEGEADQLYHEIEYYDDSNGELVAWVNIPGLSATVDTVLYMYYGNPDCGNQEYPDAVWDSDYIHVWHMGDNLEDSAGYDDGNNHGTSKVYGKIGEARDFEEDEHDFIDFGDMTQPGDGSLTTMTWEAWVKPETQDTILMTKYNTQGADYTSYYLVFSSGGKFRIGAASAFGVGTNGYTDDSYSEVGEWIYLTATYTLGGTNEIGAFINGDEVAFTHDSQSANVMKNIPVTDDLGRYRPEQTTRYADAVIDEVRWSKVVRSDDWIKTSYNNMNDPSSYLSFSAEEPNGPPDAPIINGPIEGKSGISYTYTFKSNDPDGDDVYYYIDWGDTTHEDWFGPFSSGEEVEKTHVFNNTGTYIIYAKAKDITGLESDWGTLTVIIPRDKAITSNMLLLRILERFPLLQKLLLIIK